MTDKHGARKIFDASGNPVRYHRLVYVGRGSTVAGALTMQSHVSRYPMISERDRLNPLFRAGEAVVLDPFGKVVA